jgi:ubiquinone/menaquinone biosynthesis C-methylase UbiE
MKVTAGSSDNLPFEKSSFDKIYCINVIYFWKSPQLHLREIYRVLKPGGIFCTGFRPKENLSKFSFSNFDFTFYTEGEWKNSIEENGFQFIKSVSRIDSESGTNSKNVPFESLSVVSAK